MADISKIEGYNLKDAVARKPIVSSASGTVATFSDGGDNIPVKSLVTDIVAQQASGTPSPSNPRAISGYSSITINDIGKYHRIIPTSLTPQTSNGITVTPKANGTFDVSGTATANTSMNFAFDSYVIYSDTGKKVAFNNTFRGSSIRIRFYEDSTLIDSWSLDSLKKVSGYSGMAGKTTNTFEFYVPSGATISGSFRIEFYIDSTVQTPVTITLPETIYGGTAELVGGSGVKDYGYIEFDGSSDEDWTYASGNKWASITIPDMMSGANQNGITNWLPKATTYGTFGFALGRNNNNFYAYQIPDISGVTDLATWKTYLSNNHLQVVYPLATQTSFTFTGANIPTLSGTNNVYADSGNVNALEYFNNKADDIASMVRLMTRS